jgi:hypothetical protein
VRVAVKTRAITIPTLCFENTLIAFDGKVHDPIVHIPTGEFSDEDRYLHDK